MKLFATLKAPLIGGIIGAAVIGAAWTITYASQQHGEVVVAKVNGTPITQTALSQESDAVAGSQVMAQLISNQLVLDAASKANITATPDEVNQALSSLEQQNGITSESQLNSTLMQNHMTKDQLMSQLKTQVLETKLAESKVTVSNQQISAYYTKNKNSLATPGKTPTLAQAKQTIIHAIQQQNAEPIQQLVADLTKQANIQILDAGYSSVVDELETPDTDTSGRISP